MKAAKEDRETGDKSVVKLASVGGGGADSSAILKFETDTKHYQGSNVTKLFMYVICEFS